uniref:Uncharacterized protein n=1 Tax=Anguilla anguilla TaxID=7936 RepID=A0A0E9Y2K3_ANGAN
MDTNYKKRTKKNIVFHILCHTQKTWL